MVISKIIHLGTTLRNLYASYIAQTLVANGVTASLATTFSITKVAGMSLTQVIKGLGVAFLSTPIGMISAIALGIFAVVKVTDALTTSAAEAREQLGQIASDCQSDEKEIKTLNDELTTTRDRINELKSKGKLSFTESSELKRLEAENAEREHTLELLDKELAKKQKLAINSFKSAVGKVSALSPNWDGHFTDIEDIENGQTTWGKIKGFFADFADDFSTTYIPDLSEVEEYRTALKGLYDTGYEYGTDKTVDLYIDNINRILDAYSVYIGATNTLFSSVYNRDKYSEARTAIEELGTVTAESLAGLYKKNDKVKEFVDYLLSLGTIDWKTVLGEDFDKVAGDDKIVSTAEALGWMNENADNSDKVMGLLANELNKVEEAAEGAATAVKKFSDIYDGVKDSYDIISEADEEMKEHGFLSAETVSNMEKNGLTDYLLEVENGYQLVNGAMNDWIAAQSAKYQTATDTAINNALNLAKSQGKVADGYANSAEDMLTYIKALKQTAIANELNSKQQKINEINNSTYLTPHEKSIRISSLEMQAYANASQLYDSSIAELKAAIANKKTWDRVISTLDRDKVNSSGSGKTEAEKYFDELKYKLETNQITQEQYLKDLDWGYKHFYNKTADYLEDYAKYSQEVYDGFKDMYKEDLEAQKEAWEEKKDAVSEYYDNLREQIEDAHDKEDYEKEQSEKRKEIFDLDMRIAELMRDGSEKAKARIAELEEERLKAEEELLDFETDKAREDELSRLEKEQKAEEDKIQSQIDAIDEELQKIDGDIVDGLYNVRKTIVDYAAKKGITLDFAYATGTRSSVGGFGRINEKGIEMISAPDGNGNYVNLMPNSYVFSAKATEFLWKLATEHSLPQAMYNSIAKSIKTQSNTPSVNIAQPITITMGDVIIKGNADKQTVADIKKQQENTVRMVLQKIKELQK